MNGKKQTAINGARILIKTCLSLQPNDIFLLVFDETTRHFAPLFQRAAQNTGVIYRQAFVSQKLQAAGGEAFTTELQEALSGSRGILMATTDDERCSRFRIVLTSQRRGAGNALATMPGASVEILSTAVDVDYNKIIQMCRDLTVPLIKANECKITTVDRRGNPHVLTFALGRMERVPIQSLGLIPLQAWGNVPAGETFVAPLENSAKGEYLVNGAIGTEKVTGMKEALVQFEQGRMVKHFYLHNNKPVEHLTQLKKTAETNQHGSCWNIIAEFGVGVNKRIHGIHGVQVIDEKRYGTVHVAIGHNRGYGGATTCPSVHCDMTVVAPTVELDGHKFIEHGEHVYDLSQWLDDYRSFVPAPGLEWKMIDHHVKLTEDSYQFAENDTLLAKHKTQSGRETIYALGNDITSRCACKLVRRLDDTDVRTLDELQTDLAMPAPDLINLLSLLRANRIVYP